MENAKKEAQILEFWETEDEKILSVQELKKQNFTWALENLRGKSFFNKSINQNIGVSRDGLGEWKTVTKTRDQAVSLKILGKMLENSIFWKEEQPKNNDPNIEKVIYFRQDCMINGQIYTAVITVKVYKSENYHKYYHHYLDDFFLEPQK